MEESAGLGTNTAIMASNGCGNKKSVTQIPLSESLSLLISYQVTKMLWREEAQGERKRALTPAGARGGGWRGQQRLPEHSSPCVCAKLLLPDMSLFPTQSAQRAERFKLLVGSAWEEELCSGLRPILPPEQGRWVWWFTSQPPPSNSHRPH